MSPQQPGRILLTGARAPVALDLARQFATAGWQVHTADSQPAHATAASRAVHAHHRLPPPRQQAQAFARELGALCRRQAIDLVLPTCEEVFYLAHGREQLPAHTRLVCMDLPLLRRLHSKWAFIALARQAGLRVPDSQQVHQLEQARQWAAGRPLVLKPEFSRFGVEVRLYRDGLPAAAPPLDGRPWVAQQLLPGQEICSYGVAHQGRLLAHAAYRPGWRMARSASYYFDAVDNPDILAQTTALVAALGYSGQIAFDWIVDEHGRATVIECNPRSTSAVHLFAGSDALVQAVTGNAGDCRQPAPGSAAMLAPMMWLHAAPLSLLRGQWAAWRDDYRRAVDVLARPGDARPRGQVLRDLLHYARASRHHRGNLRAASTVDIEWDGQPLP